MKVHFSRKNCYFLSKLKNGRSNATGFTIVELLIVIVIIGVLAALVIIAYNGLQQRARNTQRIVAAKEWQKLLINYVNTYGKYPSAINIGVSGTTGVCLGEGGYPDLNSDGAEDDCNSSNNTKHTHGTWISELQRITPKLPEFPKAIVGPDSNGITYLGILVRSVDTVDGVAFWPVLTYYLEGTGQSCGLAPVVSSTGTTTSAVSFSSNLGTVGTTCRIALPDPSAV